MRTTIRRPGDLYRRVRVSAASEGRTVTAFIEGAVGGVLAGLAHPPDVEPYRVSPFSGRGLQPGVDLDDSAALLDVLDGDARG